MSQKPQGAGSIWNPNSWHWEMKNYTQIAKRLVEQKTIQMDIKTQQHIIKNTEVKFVKAEAEVNIRKGKQHLVYEFELDVSFAASPRSELAENDLISGTYSVKEIASDDLNDIMIEDVKSTNKSEDANKIKAFIKKFLKNFYVQLFKTFAEDLSRIEGDPLKLEEDKKKREQALLETQKAKQEKGEEKQRLLHQQKEMEKLMKQEFSKHSKKE